MLYLHVDSFRCHTETDEVGSDEPYIIVTSVDLRGTSAGPGMPSIPESRAFLYGPFTDVDSKETHHVPFAPFWGLGGGERALSNPDDVIFLVALMENDNGIPSALRGIVAAQANSALLASLGVTNRTERVRRVTEAVSSALATPTGFPNFDDLIGLQELRFTASELASALTGPPVFRALRLKGDGGDYTINFRAVNRGQNGWRFCSKCNAMFYSGYPDRGRCPSGGGHEPQGWTFYLPHDRATWLGGQRDWRHCDRCRVMFWAGDPANQGRCAAGGSHRSQGWVFFLPHDHGGPGQDQWRFCDKCRTLFYNGRPAKGVCPAGGAHRAQGINFKLDYTP